VSYALEASSDPVDGTLGIVEEDGAFLVVVDHRPEDWLVRFEKHDEFPACQWADNMARAYNERRMMGLGR
jgi:hypothetical protein